VKSSEVSVNHLDTKKHSLSIRYLLVTWLLVVSAVAFIDRTNIAVAGVEISKDFHMDNTQLGWVFSAFLVGYAAFQIPGGIFVRSFGARHILTLSVMWSGTFVILTALLPSNTSWALFGLVGMRFLMGAGEAIMYPAMSRFVERWFPMSERGRANGIIFGGIGLGSGSAPPVATAIILHFGWRILFWCSGLLRLLVGVVWYLFSRDTPEEHPAVGRKELELIAAGRDDKRASVAAASAQAGLPAKPKQAIPWGRLFASKETLGLTAAYFTFGYVAWVFFSWFYIYLAQVRHLNLKTTAFYSMFPFIAMALGSVIGGFISDWISRHYGARAGKCYFAAFALALTAVLLLIGSHAHSAVIATIVLASGAGALYLSQSSYWAISADFGGEHAGMVSGVMNTGCQIGGAVTASLTPIIALHFGWDASFLTGASLALVGALAWLIVNPAARLAHSDAAALPG
jgi:ACS family glucarate transporter-like MFS transporter